MIDRFRPLDTREGQIEVLTSIVGEALRVYDRATGENDAEPWSTQPRDTAGLDTALVALAAILEVRRAFPVRAKPKPKPAVEIEVEVLKPKPKKVKPK